MNVGIAMHAGTADSVSALLSTDAWVANVIWKMICPIIE